jgi:hypothetical protein
LSPTASNSYGDYDEVDSYYVPTSSGYDYNHARSFDDY